jgi:NADPH:quinone reductase-like Zn-dependent oxidoreductase
MKVVELRERGGVQGLVMGERPEPRPGAGEILVRVQAATLNFRDWAIARGSYGDFPLPIVPLSDAAGEVVEVGEGASRFRAGDVVCPLYVMDWMGGPPTPEVVARRLGGPQDGVLAEYVCVPERSAVRAPRHMSALQAATLPIAGVTAWQALFVQGHVTPGDVVVVQGTGGVSLFALQLALAAGARVIATSGSPEKAERVREMGAEAVIDYRETPDWPRRVLEITDGRGADHVVEVVGGENVTRSVAATRIGGSLSLIGFLEDTRGVLDLPDAFRRVVTLHAISVGSRAAFEALVAATEANGIEPMVSRVFPFEAFRDAYRHLAGGRHMGKVAIRVAD